jgi:hypothetical protein
VHLLTLGMHYLNHIYYPFAVKQIYSSYSNDFNDSTAFITGSDCPKIFNKFECAFIPMTNCTIPTSVSSCKTKNCVHGIKSTKAFDVFYTNASTSGEQIFEYTDLLNKVTNNRGNYTNLSQKNLSSNMISYKFPYVAPYDPNVLYNGHFGSDSNKGIYIYVRIYTCVYI